MDLVAEIVIDGASGGFDKEYRYSVPESLASGALPGCRVTVPFGRGDRKRQGMILKVFSGDTQKLKEIDSVTDNEPILNDEMLQLCIWMREHTFCTYFDAIRTILPAGLNYRLTDYYSVNEQFVSVSLLSKEEAAIFAFLRQNEAVSKEKIIKNFENAFELLDVLEEKQAILRESLPIRRMGDCTRRWVRPLVEAEALPQIKLTDRQREIAKTVSEIGAISVKEIQYFTGVTVSVLDALNKKGILEFFEKEEFRTPYRLNAAQIREPIELTDEQQAAFSGLKRQLESKEPAVSLLYGVTGSGKTQVFLELVDTVSDAGRGVIVMVPEIALTPQMIEIFSFRYGNKVAVFHSAMSLGQRMDEYKRIRQGKALIAIGTRSAVFAPFSDLGLVIIDEEQEHTYKSEKSPRFHARDIARFRVGYHKSLLCLASATPSIESYSLAVSGKYQLYRLSKRYGNAVLPAVTTVDMRKEILSGNSGSISNELADAITDTLKDGKQAILLLNRRGHNTYVSCPACGWVATCPACSISLTYHSANKRLMCHYCSHSEPSPTACPQCGKDHVRFMGLGTQKVEEELKLLYPKARILRLDADSTMSREAYTTYLTAFAAGEYDIMLGTQMVAKGLNFPNVTVVGVIGADQAMYSEDYRGFERTFSLLTQVVGRAGRGDNPGRAIIQTVNPDSNVIALACKQDYDAFYEEEILTRKLHIFPPYCDICVVCVQSSVREEAQDTIVEIFSRIKEIIKSEYTDVRVMILGPAAAAIPKVNNRYRFRMIIKCKNTARFRTLLRKATDVRLRHDTGVFMDVNPESVI